MFNVSESESIVFKELDLFYHFIMGFNLFNYIFDKYEFLYNKFYGFVKKKIKTELGFIWSVFLLLLFTHKYKYVVNNCICQ